MSILPNHTSTSVTFSIWPKSSSCNMRWRSSLWLFRLCVHKCIIGCINLDATSDRKIKIAFLPLKGLPLEKWPPFCIYLRPERSAIFEKLAKHTNDQSFGDPRAHCSTVSCAPRAFSTVATGRSDDLYWHSSCKTKQNDAVNWSSRYFFTRRYCHQNKTVNQKLGILREKNTLMAPLTTQKYILGPI